MELDWPSRSAHTRAGHVDHWDDFRTLAPHVAKLEKRFSTTINDVLDKMEEVYGFVCRHEDNMEVFVRELERTDKELPSDVLEYLHSFINYMDLLYYYHCLQYTILEWRKQERRLKIFDRLHLAWTARYCPSLQRACMIRCTCEVSDEQPSAISNSMPTVQATEQDASRQDANTLHSKEILTSAASDESPLSMLICPITLELLEDPVIAADGFTYSRAAIERWLQCGRSTSPMTNLPLAHNNLILNEYIRYMVLAWRATFGDVPKSLFSSQANAYG